MRLLHTSWYVEQLNEKQSISAALILQLMYQVGCMEGVCTRINVMFDKATRHLSCKTPRSRPVSFSRIRNTTNGNTAFILSVSELDLSAKWLFKKM